LLTADVAAWRGRSKLFSQLIGMGKPAHEKLLAAPLPEKTST
jgi:hypothetical protein